MPTSLHRSDTELMGVDQEMVLRYLQYECRYRMSKYRDADVKTWGGLINDDYEHFVFLMSTEVAADSNTFLALSSFLRGEDLGNAVVSTRRRDTPEGKETMETDFLNLACTHRGRMHGRTWLEVRKKDYSYFVWAVGNTMGRDTRSFSIFRTCLHEREQALVDSAPKGQVKVPKGLKY